MRKILKGLKVSGMVVGGLAALVFLIVTVIVLLVAGGGDFAWDIGPPPTIGVKLETTKAGLNKPFTLTTTITRPGDTPGTSLK